MSRESLTETLVVAVVVTFAGGAMLSPPDPFTQIRYAVLLFPVGLLVSYIFVYRGDWGDG